jgi:hypothetical protein
VEHKARVSGAALSGTVDGVRSAILVTPSPWAAQCSVVLYLKVIYKFLNSLCKEGFR